MTFLDRSLAALAHLHLPEAVAERWAALMRPGLRLRAAQPGEPVVGSLGGLPALPPEVEWPRWDGHGPMSFIAAFDCAPLPCADLDIPLPERGTLLFFHRDSDQYPDEDTVGPWAPETQAAAQVLYVPAAEPTSEREAPPGVHVYGRVGLAAQLIVSGPDWEHPALRAALEDVPTADRAFVAEPANSDPFREAMAEQVTRPLHRLGGYAYPIQGAVEVEAAQVVLGGRADYTDPALYKEAERWLLLAQIDSDDEAGMMWGDVGALYWLMRREDLGARRFDKAVFTWQCA